MSTFWWILLSGLLMSGIALVGSLSLLVSEATLKKLLLPVVGFAAGTLVGGGLFHLLPAGVQEMGGGLTPFFWTAAGFVSFLILEQILHWHHCHRPASEHRTPLTWMILISDGLHNFIGGLAVAGSFIVDVRLGVLTWLAAAAHEIPQELGDFGILIHGGWRKGQALLFNFLSALTFPLGGILAWCLSLEFDLAFLLPFAAGNFIYIGAVDLVPELGRRAQLRTDLLHVGSFVAGMLLILGLRMLLAS